MPDRRGGARVPDGVARPKPVAFAQGPNRTDLSAIPGTPGTTLPASPATPDVGFGQAGPIRRALADIPLDTLSPGSPGLFRSGTEAPTEPVTAGLDIGAGPGSEALLNSPDALSNQLAATQVKFMFPVLMKLATLPGATNQTKILAQRLRAQLPIQPEQVPLTPGEQLGNSGPTGTNS